jgi:tRNA A-37 threonylcarbamoyl transferase component Bud32
MLTNNIIYTIDLPSIQKKIQKNNQKEIEKIQYKNFLQGISSGWKTLLIQEPIYHAFRLFFYNQILNEENRNEFLDELENTRQLFLEKGHDNKSSPQKTRKITPSPSERSTRKNLVPTEAEYYLNKISNTKEEEIKEQNTMFSKILYLNYGNEKKVVLKFNLSPSGFSASYEAYVGVFLNKLNKQFPFFVETYGCLKGPRPIEKGDNSYPRIFPSYMRFLEPVPLKYEYLKPFHSLTDSQLNAQYGILMEFIKGNSLSDYINNIEIWFLLFQVYSVLDYLGGDFVHGDLYCRNVMVVPAVKHTDIQKIKFVYHYPGGRVFTFNSSYIVKMIDFGSSNFNDRKEEEKSPSYIPYRNRNMYHDLLLFTEVCQLIPGKVPDFVDKSKKINEEIEKIKQAQRDQLKKIISKNVINFYEKKMNALENVLYTKINTEEFKKLEKEIKSFRELQTDEKKDIKEVFEFMNRKLKEVQKTISDYKQKITVVGEIHIWMDGSNRPMERTDYKEESTDPMVEDPLFPLGLFFQTRNPSPQPVSNKKKTSPIQSKAEVKTSPIPEKEEKTSPIQSKAEKTSSIPSKAEVKTRPNAVPNEPKPSKPFDPDNEEKTEQKTKIIYSFEQEKKNSNKIISLDGKSDPKKDCSIQ